MASYLVYECDRCKNRVNSELELVTMPVLRSCEYDKDVNIMIRRKSFIEVCFDCLIYITEEMELVR